MKCFLDKYLQLKQFLPQIFLPVYDSEKRFISAGIYLPKVKNRNSRTRCEVCLKLTIITRKLCCLFVSILWRSIYRLGLAHFWPMFPFYTPIKHYKTKGFLVFSGGIKWKNFPDIGLEKNALKVNQFTLYLLNVSFAVFFVLFFVGGCF